MIDLSLQPVLEIDEVILQPHPAVKSCIIDEPVAGSSDDTHTLRLAGQVVGAKKAIEAIEVVTNGCQLRCISLNAQPAFSELMGTIGLQNQFKIQLHAVYAGRQSADAQPFALIHGRRQSVQPDFAPKLQPLLVTAWGRSGTTWLMHLLAQHPEIIFLREHPYESRPALYWMHMLRVLGEPANPTHSSGRDATAISSDLWSVGQNPYYDSQEIKRPTLRRWLGRTYVEQLAGFCQRSTEEYYRQVAEEGGQETGIYFAEKVIPNYAPWIFRELYPQGREVILVRDFRDIIASSLAFNKKRGYISFGRNKVQSDPEYVKLVKTRAQALLQAWQLRAQHAHLVRYEDLIQQPHETLELLLEYLKLENSPAIRQNILQRASQDTSDLQSHRTSASPAASIGRWQRDLNHKLQSVCHNALGETMSEFGYKI